MNHWPNEAETTRELPNEIQDCFAAYRQALPDSEPSPSFMPALWQRIDARRRPGNYCFGRLARHFVMASVAFCLGTMAMLVAPVQNAPVTSPQTYVEVLDEVPSAEGVELDGDPGVRI